MNINLPNFQNIESFLSTFLYKFPKIRKFILFFYLRFFLIFNHKQNSTNKKLKIKRVGPIYDNSFFGYFDCNPANQDGLILCHHTKYTTSSFPKNNKPIFISVFDINNLNKPIITTFSFAYNWQQGSRLKWINNCRFIYNDYDFKYKKYISNLFCLKEKKIVGKFSFPSYAVYKDKFFLSLKSERLSLLQREYGYFTKPPMNLNFSKVLSKDGVNYINLENGKSKLLFSLEDCYELLSEYIPKNADHVINHLLISDDGNKFIFLYRVIFQRGRIDFLMKYDFELSKLKLLIKPCLISHYCWIDNNSLLVFMYPDNKIGNYYKVNTNDGNTSNIFLINEYALTDGHPSKIDSYNFVTDTYPDRNRFQKLILLNIKTKKIENILELQNDLSFNGFNRCDMHPRYDNYNKKIFFDSVDNGERKLNFIDFD
tara:strand:- start:90 stop:1370 length:1281 start_codon:yes stop_codon:yes gene_type:complete